MRELAVRLYTVLQILREESGQDLVEYALIAALIAFGAIAGMTTLATDLNLAFDNIGKALVTYTNK